MEQMPIIKLEIENMKYSILHYFNQHQERVSEAVAAQIEKVISSYDYEGAVLKATTEVLDGTIESFFKYGKGRTMIQDAIQEALEKTFTLKQHTK